MQESLTATDSINGQQPFGDTGNSGLQQTRSSEALGVHVSNQPATTDNNLMDFLSSEAAGSVHDTTPKSETNYQNIGLGGLVIFMAVLMSAVLIFYKGQIHKKLNS